MSIMHNGEKVLNNLTTVPITQTINASSTDTQIPSAKAVNDLLQTEGSGNLTIPLNEDLNNLAYNRTRVWMNSQTDQIETFTNMPSGRYTECAVIFIPYGKDNVNYGEQIFVGNKDRIFIRNKIRTEWTAWQRVCATSVADVPLTVVSTNDVFTSTNDIQYSVLNGMCTLKFEASGLSYTTDIDHSWAKATDDILPRSKMGVKFPLVCAPSGKIILCTIDINNDHLKVYGIIPSGTTAIYGSVSYPVKES